MRRPVVSTPDLAESCSPVRRRCRAARPCPCPCTCDLRLEKATVCRQASIRTREEPMGSVQGGVRRVLALPSAGRAHRQHGCRGSMAGTQSPGRGGQNGSQGRDEALMRVQRRIRAAGSSWMDAGSKVPLLPWRAWRWLVRGCHPQGRSEAEQPRERLDGHVPAGHRVRGARARSASQAASDAAWAGRGGEPSLVARAGKGGTPSSGAGAGKGR